MGIIEPRNGGVPFMNTVQVIGTLEKSDDPAYVASLNDVQIVALQKRECIIQVWTL